MSATIEGVRAAGRTLLTEVESKAVLREAGIPTTEARAAANPDAAVRAADAIGYPVVLKVLSPQITHKSDVGGVLLNVADADAVRAGYASILERVRAARPDAQIDGVSVQGQAAPGTEVIVGVTTDATFGPVVMVGLGGVLVEVLRDVAFRVVPLEPRDAAAMIRELTGLPLLQGYRGAPPADLAAIEKLILDLSAFVDAHPEISELDLNPVFAYPDGVLAVDARIVLTAAA